MLEAAGETRDDERGMQEEQEVTAAQDGLIIFTSAQLPPLPQSPSFYLCVRFLFLLKCFLLAFLPTSLSPYLSFLSVCLLPLHPPYTPSSPLCPYPPVISSPLLLSSVHPSSHLCPYLLFFSILPLSPSHSSSVSIHNSDNKSLHIWSCASPNFK